jgi:hypothetical protein
MKLKFRELSNDEFELWDAYVEKHPSATCFHSTTWLSLVGENPKVIAAFNKEELTGGFAYVETVKNSVKGLHIPPYTQYFSPLFGIEKIESNSYKYENEFLEGVLILLPKTNHLDFKLPRGHQNILAYNWAGFQSAATITYTINGSLKEYLKGLNKNKLRELNKLIKMLEEGDLEVVDDLKPKDWLPLMESTSERGGYNARLHKIQSIVENCPSSMCKKIGLICKEHGLISFGFFPFDKNAVYNIVNASMRVDHPVLKTINLLLLYLAIEFALNNQKTFDFEGSMLKGVSTFNQLMGGTQLPIYRVQKSPGLVYSILISIKQIKDDRM